jgi:hypothetical protein
VGVLEVYGGLSEVTWRSSDASRRSLEISWRGPGTHVDYPLDGNEPSLCRPSFFELTCDKATVSIARCVLELV